MDQLLAKADYPAAITKIEEARQKAYTYKDRVVYYLNIGMLHHWNGDYEKSNEMLEKAERGIEENFTKSISRTASSMIMNDNILAYAGEDYEDIYLNVFKALNYLALGRNDDAFVEVRRIDNKLVQLESKYDKVARKMSQAEEAHETFVPGKSHFQGSALGRYLSMMLYRADHKWDDVRIDLEKLDRGWKLQPDIYTFPKPDLSSSTKRITAPRSRLNVIAFSGLAPDKKASTFYIHTEENIIVLAGSSENYLGKQNLSGLSVIPWDGINEGYHFKIQLPYMEKRPSKVAYIQVEVAGMATQNLQQLESLENAAVETFSIQKPLIYLKTITRAVIKGLAAEKAKQDMTESMDSGMAFFTRLAADLMVDSTENADLRVSRFFPAEAAIRELHLEEGTYDIRINYYGTGGNLLYIDKRVGVRIEAGHLNVLESSYLN
jgi:tetratricopeptide (TPR) repeat protein